MWGGEFTDGEEVCRGTRDELNCEVATLVVSYYTYQRRPLLLCALTPRFRTLL